MHGCESFCADEEVPRLDAGRHDSVGALPRVLGKAGVDRVFVLCVSDEQHADTALLASCQRAGEDNDSLIGERAYVRRVLVDCGLAERAFPVLPRRTGSRNTAK